MRRMVYCLSIAAALLATAGCERWYYKIFQPVPEAEKGTFKSKRDMEKRIEIYDAGQDPARPIPLPR